MSILANKGRVIESLVNYPSPQASDLLVIQDIVANQTKNIALSQLSDSVLLQIQTKPVKFDNVNNKFTGSFRGGFFYGTDGYFATSLQAIGGKLSVTSDQFLATNFLAMKFGTLGAAIQFYNSLNVLSGSVSAGSFVGNFTGSLLGNVRGDIYSDTGNKVLDNSANLAKNALFYGTASYVRNATSASHAQVADTTLSCVTHTTNADYATSAHTASYASASRSASYLKYVAGKSNGSASFAVKAGVANALAPGVVTPWAQNAYTASLATKANSSAYSYDGAHATNADFAKYANTASFLQYTGQYNGSASYSVMAGQLAQTYSDTSNYNLSVVNPTGVITYKKYFYYNQFNTNNSTQNLMRLDQKTGAIQNVNNSLVNGGRMALFNFNYNPPSPGFNEGGIQDRIVYFPNSNIVIVSNLLGTTPVVRVIPVSDGGDWRKFRCVYVDTTVSGNQSDVHPTFYMWDCNFDTTYSNLSVFYKIYFDGTNYVHTLLTNYVPNFASTDAINNIVNYSNFAAIENDLTVGIWSYNYNPVKKRLYIMSGETGLVNIFKINDAGIGAGITNIVTWWQLPNNGTKYSYLTYEKSVLISTGFSYNNSGAREILDFGALEYDTTTGKELFWSINKYGIDQYWPGVISKAAYWES